MTTKITVEAACNRETTVVQVYVWDTSTDETLEKKVLQDGEKHSVTIWGYRVVAVGEIPKKEALEITPVDLVPTP